jgi:hypothetical protein
VEVVDRQDERRSGRGAGEEGGGLLEEAHLTVVDQQRVGGIVAGVRRAELGHDAGELTVRVRGTEHVADGVGVGPQSTAGVRRDPARLRGAAERRAVVRRSWSAARLTACRVRALNSARCG